MSHANGYERMMELDEMGRDSAYDRGRSSSISLGRNTLTGKPYFQVAQNEYNDHTPSPYLGGSAPNPIALGVPGRKPYLEIMDLLALLLALTCLAVAVCVITPRLTLAWHLGYTSQLIIIGFLLSIMNLALNRIITALFFMIEVRFGSSTLQNYEALLRKQPLATTGVSTIWRVILTLFIALPLGLSAGYKRYFGGMTSADITPKDIPFHMYGTTALPGLNGMGDSVGTAILINSTIPFLVASKNDSALPANFSALYGQNVYLMSNTSAAMLDLPMPKLVSSIQQSLQGTNKKTLSARVHAFVTTFNASAEQDRNVPGYFDEMRSNPAAGLTDVSLFTTYWVYTFMNQFYGTDGTWMYVALCEQDQFESSAHRFDTYRHLCNATWDITSQTMNLINASCEQDPLADQTLLRNQSSAVNYWYTGILADNIGAFSESRAASEWRMPTFVVSVASMYWARYVAFTGPSALLQHEAYDSNTLQPYELYYSVPDHTMVSSKACIDPQWSLLAILALQPALIVLVVLLKAVFHATPVGEGFGLVTILAGLNTKNLTLLKGASLTGDLKRPIRLAIGVVDRSGYGASRDRTESVADSSDASHISFVVDGYEDNGTLLRGKKYQ